MCECVCVWLCVYVNNDRDSVILHSILIARVAYSLSHTQTHTNTNTIMTQVTFTRFLSLKFLGCTFVFRNPSSARVVITKCDFNALSPADERAR